MSQDLQTSSRFVVARCEEQKPKGGGKNGFSRKREIVTQECTNIGEIHEDKSLPLISLLIWGYYASIDVSHTVQLKHR